MHMYMCVHACMRMCTCVHVRHLSGVGELQGQNVRTSGLFVVYPEAPGSWERYRGPLTVRLRKLSLNFPNHQGEYCGCHQGNKESNA